MIPFHIIPDKDVYSPGVHFDLSLPFHFHVSATNEMGHSVFEKIINDSLVIINSEYNIKKWVDGTEKEMMFC